MTSSVDSYIGFQGLRFVRCTGAEYVSFLEDTGIWPEGRFITQMVNRIDGEWEPDDLKLCDIPPTAVVEISDQGGVAENNSLQQWNIIEYFIEWKTNQ